MSELFKTILKSLPPKSPSDYKRKYHITIKAVGGGCCFENINRKIPHFKRRRLRKMEQIKEVKIKEKLWKANDH